jgi:hypothetical protein
MTLTFSGGGLKRARFLLGAIVAAAAAMLALCSPPGAEASLKQELAQFADCPVNTPGVQSCLLGLTTGGEFHLGNETVPINRTVTLQAGIIPGQAKLVPAIDGNTLSKTPLTVPGGLLGIELLGNLTEVTATAELVSPPEFVGGTTLPIKIKLDNLALGPACYIGSNSEPVVLKLIFGTTNPPPPNQPISGSTGTGETRWNGELTVLNNTSLVDNAFAVPGANGCGGLLAPIVDASVDLKTELPSPAGHNTAILNGALELANAEFVHYPPPEFGRCVKVAKNTGRYHSSNCAGGLEQGSFEWQRGVVNKKFTTSLTSSKTTLETVHRTKVVCTGESGTGEYSGLKEVTGVVMHLTGCESRGSTCASSSTAGEVVTKPLQGALGITNETVEAGVEHRAIGLDLYPAGKTGPLAEFSCGGVPVVVKGSVIAPVTANKMSAASSLSYKALEGKQAPEQFEEEPKDVLETSFSGGAAEQSGLTGKFLLSSEEAVEVNSAV